MATEGQRIQYRNNVLRNFLDTEFYEDGTTIDLISIGAARSDGAEYYAVSTDAKLDRVSDWVRENVVAQLPPRSDPAWKPREQIAAEYSEFMKGVEETWAYYADYDHVAVCQLYGTMMGLPDHFKMYCLDLKQLSYMLGNPKHPPSPAGAHNALVDAKWNRDVLFPFLRSYRPGLDRLPTPRSLPRARHAASTSRKWRLPSRATSRRSLRTCLGLKRSSSRSFSRARRGPPSAE
jgi:hypothetical protein